ncbi:unnamed protein product [Rotaria socialis]|uniref:Retrovirus-related Pol polyprotein from transposon TNT 1-94-like beta-barrel domain-containing protein n=1 Tax=Rotaria socialis TaxID=392032 RepID=A0A821PGU6_9BILA|nr:unnamed protein product [Rotaria socialis]CAF4804686.1 unnamed protein product [Rotaria socialis]
MVNNKKLLRNIKPNLGAIRLADNSKMNVDFSGEITGYMTSDTHKALVTFKNVLFVPSLSDSLFSISAPIDQDILVSFGKQTATIISNKIKDSNAPRNGNLFEYDF